MLPSFPFGGNPDEKTYNSILDLMTPEQLNLFTPEAKKILSQVPAIVKSLNKGGEVNKYTIIPGIYSKSVANINPKIIGTDMMIHEALHALDFSNPTLKRGGATNLSGFIVTSPELRAKLMKKYYANFGNKYTGGNSGNETHIPQTELFATGGQDPNNIDPEIQQYYKKYLNPPTNSTTQGSNTNNQKPITASVPPPKKFGKVSAA